jgi:hypothetical protein
VVTNQVGGQLYLEVENKISPGGFNMNRYFTMSKVGWLLAAFLTIGFSTSRAQKIKNVDFDLPSLDYDVIYLGDFIDISSNKLAKNIPNFSGTIRADGAGYIVLHATVLIQLQGDPGPQELVYAETNPFFINGSRSLTASDLATGSTSDIQIKGSPYRENSALRSRIEDYAKQLPTAPVGRYFIQLVAFDSSNTSPLGSGTQKIITIRNASPDEVQVNLIDPQPGAVVSTTLPTFSWSSANSNVTVYVFEMLRVYQSIEEAITGIPYLKQDISGAQSFTYPANALRRLEQNKSYVWYVEAAVTTNRQTIQRRSEIRLFRIQSDNRANQEISDMMNNFGNTVAGTFSTLQSIGWIPNGTITLDGKPLTLDDLKALVAKLTAQNVQVTVRVE